MATLRGGMTGAALLALLTLAACGREGQDQMSWARAALERNKDVEIVTADQESRTFTVRVKDSKELIKVRVDELVVAPATVAPAPAGTLASAAAAPGTPTEAAPAAAMAPATPGEPASAEGAAAPTDSASRFVGTEGSGGAPQLEQPGGRVLRAGPGYTIKAAAGGAGAAQPARRQALRERSGLQHPVRRRRAGRRTAHARDERDQRSSGAAPRADRVPGLALAADR